MYGLFRFASIKVDGGEHNAAVAVTIDIGDLAGIRLISPISGKAYIMPDGLLGGIMLDGVRECHNQECCGTHSGNRPANCRPTFDC